MFSPELKLQSFQRKLQSFQRKIIGLAQALQHLPENLREIMKFNGDNYAKS